MIADDVCYSSDEHTDEHIEEHTDEHIEEHTVLQTGCFCSDVIFPYRKEAVC